MKEKQTMISNFEKGKYLHINFTSSLRYFCYI